MNRPVRLRTNRPIFCPLSSQIARFAVAIVPVCAELSVVRTPKRASCQEIPQIVEKIYSTSIGHIPHNTTGKIPRYFTRIAALTKNCSTARRENPDYYIRQVIFGCVIFGEERDKDGLTSCR